MKLSALQLRHSVVLREEETAYASAIRSLGDTRFHSFQRAAALTAASIEEVMSVYDTDNCGLVFLKCLVTRL